MNYLIAYLVLNVIMAEVAARRMRTHPPKELNQAECDYTLVYIIILCAGVPLLAYFIIYWILRGRHEQQHGQG